MAKKSFVAYHRLLFFLALSLECSFSSFLWIEDWKYISQKYVSFKLRKARHLAHTLVAEYFRVIIFQSKWKSHHSNHFKMCCRSWMDWHGIACMDGIRRTTADGDGDVVGVDGGDIHYLGNLACVIICIMYFSVWLLHTKTLCMARDKHVLIIGCQTEINSTELIISCLEPRTSHTTIYLWKKCGESKINRCGWERMRHIHRRCRTDTAVSLLV